MESTTACLVVILSLGLLHPSSGDIFDDIIPSFMERFNTIRKSALPIPESAIDEGVYQLGSYYIPIDGKTELCRNHSNYLFENFLEGEIWALKFVDASSKIPSGLIDGHLVDLGSYDQCLNIPVPGELFRGQHCLVETRGLLPDSINVFNPEEPIFPLYRIDAMFFLCVPSTCTADDVMAHMNVALSSLNATATLIDDNCSSTVPIPFSVGDWAATIFFILLIALLIVGTIYDTNSGRNPYLRAFSLTSNIPKMLSTRISPDAITSLNGLRCLGFLWVALGHRLLFLILTPNIRYKNISENINSMWFAPIENGMLAVDIFFFMTGVLATYGYLRHRSKGKSVSLVHFYLLRYVRLTPNLLVIMIFLGTIGIRVTDGPYWRKVFNNVREFCHKTWWTNLFYLQNYLNRLEACVPHSWYLAADFQMYFFSPLLLIPLHKKPKLGLALTALFLAMTTVAGLWNVYALGLRAGGAVTMDRRTELTIVNDYMVTHLRAASFIIGVALGFLLFKIKQGHIILKLSKANLWAGWLLAIFFILFSVLFVNHFQQPNYVYNPWIEISYQVLHRHLFTLGLAWVVLACTLGYGGFVDSFLSWNVFIPLARLTYSAYLVHVIVQLVFALSSRTPISIGLTTMWYDFSADVSISYLIAAVFYLLVECPVANLVSIALEGKKKPEENLEIPQTVLNGSTSQLPVFKYNPSA